MDVLHISIRVPRKLTAREIVADNLRAESEYAAIARDPAALAQLNADMDAWEAAPSSRAANLLPVPLPK